MATKKAKRTTRTKKSEVVFDSKPPKKVTAHNTSAVTSRGFPRHWGLLIILVVTMLFALLLVILTSSFLLPDDNDRSSLDVEAMRNNMRGQTFSDADVDYTFDYPGTMHILVDKNKTVYLSEDPLSINSDGTITAPFTIRQDSAAPEAVAASFAAKKLQKDTKVVATLDKNGKNVKDVDATLLTGDNDVIMIVPHSGGSLVLNFDISKDSGNAATMIAQSFALTSK